MSRFRPPFAWLRASVNAAFTCSHDGRLLHPLRDALLDPCALGPCATTSPGPLNTHASASTAVSRGRLRFIWFLLKRRGERARRPQSRGRTYGAARQASTETQHVNPGIWRASRNTRAMLLKTDLRVDQHAAFPSKHGVVSSNVSGTRQRDH